MPLIKFLLRSGTCYRAHIYGEVIDPHKRKRGFSREQAADYCGVSIYKVAIAIRYNTLPAVRHGKDIIILREDLDAWMESWEPV